MPRPRSAPSSPNRLSHCVVDTVGRIQVRCCGLVPLRVRAAAEGALSQPADVGAGRGSNRRRGRPCAPPCLLVLGKGPWAPLMPIWLGGFVHNAEVCMLGALLCVLRMLASYPPPSDAKQPAGQAIPATPSACLCAQRRRWRPVMLLAGLDAPLCRVSASQARCSALLRLKQAAPAPVLSPTAPFRPTHAASSRAQVHVCTRQHVRRRAASASAVRDPL